MKLTFAVYLGNLIIGAIVVSPAILAILPFHLLFAFPFALEVYLKTKTVS